MMKEMQHVRDRLPRTIHPARPAIVGAALLSALALATPGAAVAAPAQARATPCTGAANPLAGTKLTLPISDSGGTSGNHAKEVSPATLYPPYLTKGADGSLDFYAPTHGATTSNSQHARSELVSLTNWSMGQGSHTMCATAEVVRTPAASHDIIIGQIHAAGAYSALPFVMLHDDNGELRVSVVDSTADKQQVTVYPLLGGVPTGTAFGYRLTDNGDGTMTFTVTSGSRSAGKQVAVPVSFRGLPVRFSAGAYNQDPATSTTPGSAAQVDFSALSSLTG
jgi:hypothetical protein